jgi:hypothetical protein
LQQIYFLAMLPFWVQMASETRGLATSIWTQDGNFEDSKPPFPPEWMGSDYVPIILHQRLKRLEQAVSRMAQKMNEAGIALTW